YLLEASRDVGADNKLSLGLDTVALGTYNCLLAITVMQTTGTSPELYAIGTLAYSLHLFGVNIFLYKTHPGHMSGWLRAYFVASLAVGILIGLNADKSSMIYSIATGLTGGVIIALSLRVKLPSLSAVNTKALLIGVVFAAVALVLAYSPGGLAEMSIIAVSIGRDVAFVGVHHILRVLAALVLAPVLVAAFTNPSRLSK
ncbi:AbrB family transcriptional regulator, partial [Ruegeria sp. ANG10]|uniref:AbrB family transcriptional regulator n=1 Tax=Ruegeria sp. ANG10 TaxID=3042467 RepID=UPI0034532390